VDAYSDDEGPAAAPPALVSTAALCKAAQRKKRSTAGKGDCLLYAFEGAGTAAGLSPHGATKPKAAAWLREAIAGRASAHRAAMDASPGVWQRRRPGRTTRRGPTGPSPPTAAAYGAFVGRPSEWCTHFDVALLAELLAAERGDGPARRLIVLDAAAGQPRHHHAPSAACLVPCSAVAPEDVSDLDVVIGLDADLHWWATAPL